MKKTAVAPSNIAFIKYWGKIDEEMRIPANSSISMNLSGAQTITTVEFSDAYSKDESELIGGMFGDFEKERIIGHLNRIRQKANLDYRAKVVTKNSFPKGTGIASSASGFAALTVAGAAAAGLILSEKELTILARLGSGSACRSIPDGFVEWTTGKTSEESYAHSLFLYTYWDLRDILIIVDQKTKETGSAEGMKNAATSPFWTERQKEVENRISQIKNALKEKNFENLGKLIEDECISAHSVMMTQSPSLYYWGEGTRDCISKVKKWRDGGLPVFFTIDAGPNVHLLCEGKDEARVLDNIRALLAVQSIIINSPCGGTRIADRHLF